MVYLPPPAIDPSKVSLRGVLVDHCRYSGVPPPLTVVCPLPWQVSLRGVLVDHCRYLGVYIGVRAQHPSVWLRAP